MQVGQDMFTVQLRSRYVFTCLRINKHTKWIGTKEKRHWHI